MAFGGSSKGIQNEINVTPLVDVVLVLLIIFMVMTPMLERGKQVQLPKSKISDENKSAEALIISLPADHTVWLESTFVPQDALRTKVAEAVRRDPTRKILIKGDESLTVGDVRQVMAEASAAGAKGIALAVEVKEVKK